MSFLLTAREQEVLLLIAYGHCTKDIGAILGVSPATISTHRKHICNKLRTHSNAKLIQHAILFAGGGAPDGPLRGRIAQGTT